MADNQDIGPIGEQCQGVIDEVRQGYLEGDRLGA